MDVLVSAMTVRKREIDRQTPRRSWQRLRSRHPRRASDWPITLQLLAGLRSDEHELDLGMYSLASSESLITYGCPPCAMRICSLVSGKSVPGTVGFSGIAADMVVGSTGRGVPSSRAFSLAAFSARSRLSASIWALIHARAFASSCFSASRSGYGKGCGRMCTSHPPPTFGSSHSFPMSLGDPRVSGVADGCERDRYLCQFPPDLPVRLGLFGLLGGLFCSFSAMFAFSSARFLFFPFTVSGLT